MEKNSYSTVCVTGGSGYIGSWLVKKLLERGPTVHATLRNLEDKSKTGLLKSLPNADTNLVLFQADIYNSNEFETAIKGCEFVFHVATPMQHNTQSSQFKDTAEAAIAGVRNIADSCIRLQTVKRLIYTASMMVSSSLTEDLKFKSCVDESRWTPLHVSFTYSNEFTLGYIKSKTLAEKEVLSYNKIHNGKLEVVTLSCGLVGGDTLLSYIPSTMSVILSQVTGNLSWYNYLRLLQELWGSIPLVHIDDICQAHIFYMEKQSIRGKFLCAVTNPTIRDIAIYLRENYPDYNITEEFMGGQERGIGCDSTKLMNMGFEYKYDVKKIIDDSVECGRRLGALLK